MKAAIILVGTELLNGGVVDTNSVYMAKELNKYGIEIEFKLTVRDFMDEIIKAIDYAKKNVDVVIMSGGLGPTLDDITKEAIAKYLGKKMVVNEDDIRELEEKFKKINLKLQTHKEIEKPEGAIVFPNDEGMAPGIFIDGIAAFPGIPRELKDLFPKFLTWFSKENNLNDEIYIKDILTYGIPEFKLQLSVSDLFDEDGIYYEFLVTPFAHIIRLQGRLETKNKVEKIKEKIYNRIGYFIFGEDDERLESKVYEYLKKYNLSISVSESCTGGSLSARLISLPGISQFYKEGIISYSNGSKVDRLGVKKETLEKYGAVSEEVAKEMIDGYNTDIAISTTGIFGPAGGTEEKPVGLVYIGLKILTKKYVIKKIFTGTRQHISNRTILTALFELLKKLEELKYESLIDINKIEKDVYNV